MIFKNDFMEVVFNPEGGGFPSQIHVRHPSGNVPALNNPAPFLKIHLSDGRRATPFLPADFTVTKSAIEGAERIQFDAIRFKDQHGAIVDDFLLSMRYEFWDDGTVFAQSYFTVDAFFDRPGIHGFKFDIPLALGQFDKIYQPSGMSPNMDTEGTMEAFEDHTINEITPSINFNCSSSQFPGMYFEVFMENNETLSMHKQDAETSITWKDKSPTISWDFQTQEMMATRERQWEWNARWGWLFAVPPACRRLPPMRMYHLLDYFECRIPPLEQLEAIASTGADVIILHEIWRLNIVSDSFPYAPERLKEFIDAAHQHGIRMVLYVRGHGDTGVAEDFCDWFGTYLRKNHDGLYMDFGGARNGAYVGPCACEPRCLFRAHYLKMRRVRREIGNFGLLFAHSGCLASAVGLTPNLIDGYVAGEGERGALSKSRFSHECLSGSYVTTGTMWTAAFPHYSGNRMIPFMAATGQYPHAPLGVQFRSSSLAHPNFPGMNDVVLRPLWKLWGTFKGQKNIAVLNDFNGCDALTNPDRETGASLMIARETGLALLILSNFRCERRRLSVNVEWETTGFSPKAIGASVYRLAPATENPGMPMRWEDFEDFAAEVDAEGCVGFLIGKAETLTQPLENFAKPYPTQTIEGERHLRRVREQKRLREAPAGSSPELFIKVLIPAPPNTLVCAYAFHKVLHEIGIFEGTGGFAILGYLSVNGFMKSKPVEEDLIWAGCSSPWINLRHLPLPPGRHRLGIRSFSLGVDAYFHSLVEVIVSTHPDENAKGAYRLVFMNEVEPERETLHFEVSLG